ncbi:MAG: hypothetical protein H0X33_14150 [Taibaiella sp.]|nr:hypothetical protein [Taibaiella sp.]
MPKLIFTQDEVNDFLKEKKEVKGIYYESSVIKADDIRVHADGVFPVKLIRERRPNEPLEVFVYRELIFKPKTKPTFSKVFSSLQKIRRSTDWSIKYDDDSNIFSKIAEDETLESYCEHHFPYFTSMTNWVFALLLRKYLIDSNAVVLVMPSITDIQPNEYLQPFPEIYESHNVLLFVPEDYAVLKIPSGCIYYERNKAFRGNSFYFVTVERIFRYDQINKKGDYSLMLDYEHGIGVLPVVKLGGVVIDQFAGQSLYESRIAAMLPELDEALREYSDLQASVVVHLYPERWEYTQNECSSCKGTGKRRNPMWIDGQTNVGIPVDTACDAIGCHNGYIVSGPYSKIMVRPTTAMEGGGTVPTPPAGYIQKDVAIIKLQDERVAQHEYDALAAINFQFLANTPLNQSGTAKAVDKDELNNTVHSIAEDIVKVMDNIYFFIARYRYKDLYPLMEIDGMLPIVTVPEKYDLLSVDNTQKEILALRNAKINPYILNAIEVDFATKRFNSEPAIRDMVHLILNLDPLSNITEDEKMTRLSNKGITQETYVISSNIQEFVQRAIDEYPNFVELTQIEQKAKILEYATEQIAAEAPQINMDAGLNLYGVPVGNAPSVQAPILVGDKVRVQPGHEVMPQHKNVDLHVTAVSTQGATVALPDGTLSSDYRLTSLIPLNYGMGNFGTMNYGTI